MELEAPKREKLSIHGRDVQTGKKSERVYNPNPQEPKEPTTKRGKRRRAAKLAAKAGK